MVKVAIKLYSFYLSPSAFTVGADPCVRPNTQTNKSFGMHSGGHTGEGTEKVPTAFPFVIQNEVKDLNTSTCALQILRFALNDRANGKAAGTFSVPSTRVRPYSG